MNDSATDVLIVGAGPYGLSIAAHAQGRGLRTRVIGTPMRFWDENMPIGMFLKSEPFASNLGSPVPDRGFTDHHPDWGMGRPIPLDTFVSYGRWFARQLAEQAEPTEVVSVDHDVAGYLATLATGETIRARAVVVAIGVGSFAHTPPELAPLPADLLSHTADHNDLSVFAGQDVAIVGAGQSALGTAVLLAEAGARPRVVARAPELSWNSVPAPDPSWSSRLLRGPQSGLGRGWRTWLWSEHPEVARRLSDRARQNVLRNTMRPAGAWWLRDRFDERIEVMLGQRITETCEADGRAVVTTVSEHGHPQIVTADHVMAATGFVVDLDRIDVLSAGVRGRLRTLGGSPKLGSHFQSSLPGLYFGGLTAAASFGPVMRFVHGADFCARRIAEHIASNAPVTTAIPAARASEERLHATH
ncbi:NAD(P)-binding domain-containing protein [Actinomadura hibisca]|uniref:NAD(P)-binding domain-containing protein n=1 Tax=Actinomadura hibisca TaxID=68565 RepID=UPI0008310B96|nr:NAD(P)-binding domain-containing protein [Actinomadura hibisca]